MITFNMAFLETIMDLADTSADLSKHNSPAANTEPETADDEEMKLRKNRPLGFYLRQVVCEKLPDIKARSMRNISTVEAVAKDLFSALAHPLSPFSPFIQRKRKHGDKVGYRLDHVDSETFELRIFLKSFLYPNSFKLYSGVGQDVPVGRICYKLNLSMTSEEKMVLHQTWGPCLDHEGFIRPTTVATVLGAAVKLLVENDVLEDDVTSMIVACTQEPSGVIELTLKAYPQPIRLLITASNLGYDLPQGTRLQHAMPKQIPYSVTGKSHIREVSAEISDGQSLWTADAINSTEHNRSARMQKMAEKSWSLNFNPMMQRILNNAVKDMNFTDQLLEYSALFQQLRDSNDTLQPLGLDIFRTVLLFELKSGNTNRNPVFEDCFVGILRRLSVVLGEGSCAHFFMPSCNILSGIKRASLRDMAILLEIMVNDMVVDPVSVLKHMGCMEDIEHEEDNTKDTVH